MIRELAQDTIAYDEGWRFSVKRIPKSDIEFRWCDTMFGEENWEAYNARWYLFKNQEHAQLFFLTWDCDE